MEKELEKDRANELRSLGKRIADKEAQMLDLQKGISEAEHLLLHSKGLHELGKITRYSRDGIYTFAIKQAQNEILALDIECDNLRTYAKVITEQTTEQYAIFCECRITHTKPKKTPLETAIETVNQVLLDNGVVIKNESEKDSNHTIETETASIYIRSSNIATYRKDNKLHFDCKPEHFSTFFTAFLKCSATP
jgi:hypothetical protein